LEGSSVGLHIAVLTLSTLLVSAACVPTFVLTFISPKLLQVTFNPLFQVCCLRLCSTCCSVLYSNTLAARPFHDFDDFLFIAWPSQIVQEHLKKIFQKLEESAHANSI
jgi:hypothetical protein